LLAVLMDFCSGSPMQFLSGVDRQDMIAKSITVEGNATLAKQAPSWIRLDKVVGRDFPVVKGAG
jgi:hypothetical protein